MTIIQGYVHDEAQKVNMVAPVIPTVMMTIAKRLRFPGVDENNVSSGVVPMALVPTGALVTGNGRSIGIEALAESSSSS